MAYLVSYMAQWVHARDIVSNSEVGGADFFFLVVTPGEQQKSRSHTVKSIVYL